MPVFERDVGRYCVERGKGETTPMYIGMTFGSRLSVNLGTPPNLPVKSMKRDVSDS